MYRVQPAEYNAHSHAYIPTVLLQYVDALRLGNLAAFCDIEAESGDWWHVLLDRGAGAALHFAVDHGQERRA